MRQKLTTVEREETKKAGNINIQNTGNERGQSNTGKKKMGWKEGKEENKRNYINIRSL